jgi:hypothetical protein
VEAHVLRWVADAWQALMPHSAAQTGTALDSFCYLVGLQAKEL